MDPNEKRDAQPSSGSDAAQRRSDALSAEETLQGAPPGSGIINSTRTGLAVSENPVIRAHRDAGDILADQVQEERDQEGGTAQKS